MDTAALRGPVLSLLCTVVLKSMTNAGARVSVRFGGIIIDTIAKQEPKTSDMPGEQPTTEPHPQPSQGLFFMLEYTLCFEQISVYDPPALAS